MFPLSISRIVFSLIAVFFLSDALMKYFRGEKSHTTFKLAVSVFIWGVALALAIMPRLDHAVSKQFGFGKDIDVLILGGFVVVLVFLFNLLRITERIERNITEIVREQCLDKFKEKLDQK